MLELLTGLPGTGKTTQVKDRYRLALKQAADRGELARTLWLSPTHRSVNAASEQLLTEELTCCWAPGVMTFDQFAERVLRAARVSASMLTNLQRRMLIAQVIQHANSQQELRHFRNVGSTTGFVGLVSRFISELKSEETWPEQFLAALDKREVTLKDRELCLLYERYQQQLLDWDKYDAEGRFWLARSELAKGNWQAFPHLSLVVVDGFTDFTRTQYEMLLLLARHAEEMVVTLPLADDADPRADLFAKPSLALRILKQDAKSKSVPVTVSHMVSGGASYPADHNVLRDRLFTNPREIVPVDASAGLTTFTALGPRAEVREVVLRVKKLLQEGVPAEDIIITTRDLNSSAALLRDICSDAGIPCFLEQSLPVSTMPLAKSISALLNVVQQDWSYGSLKKLLRHTALKLPGIPSIEESSRSVLHSLRKLNLRQGQYEIQKTLQSISTRETEKNQESRTPHYQQALEMLSSLQESLAPLQKRRTYGEHTQQLLATARGLFVEDQYTKENESGSPWDFIIGLLREAAEFQDQLSGGSQKISLAEYTQWMEQQFQQQTIASRSAQAGEVLILPADSARHLQVPHLFVFGLHENSFPGSGEFQPFYSEYERREWNELGIPLNLRATHYQEEMQFFYRLLTRSQQQLTLSYALVTPKGQPQYASPFYQAARELFTSRSLPEPVQGQLSPVPKESQLLTHSDFRMQAVDEMLHHRAGLLSWWLAQPEHQSQGWRLLSAVWMNSHRFEQHGFTPFEGMLESPRNLEALVDHYHRNYTFSATRLERYAQCPFRYFLEYELKIDPLSLPQMATDHARRGNIVHDLLSQLHADDLNTLLPENRERPPEKLASRFAELLAAQFESQYSRSDLQKILNDLEQTLLSEWAELYSEQTQNYVGKLDPVWTQTPQARYREVSFGRLDKESATPELPAVEFGTEEQSVRVEGRIDRIDVGEFEGQPVFTVIDYKTGRIPSVNQAQVSRGTQLQLALYTIAVIRLKLLGPDAAPYHVGYWNLKEKGFVAKFVRSKKGTLQPLSEELLQVWGEELDRLLPQMAAALRQGEFPVINEDLRCTERCPFKTSCRVNQVRAVADRLDKRWSFVAESNNTDP